MAVPAHLATSCFAGELDGFDAVGDDGEAEAEVVFGERASDPVAVIDHGDVRVAPRLLDRVDAEGDGGAFSCEFTRDLAVVAVLRGRNPPYAPQSRPPAIALYNQRQNDREETAAP